jgi:citrate synthase
MTPKRRFVMSLSTREISRIVRRAVEKAHKEIGRPAEAAPPKRVKWPVECTVGPGLEGAIACESKVGYVNGSRGSLIYRGYDVLDLCAHSTFEEVSYLLLHGKLPTEEQLGRFKQKLADFRHVPKTLRLLMGFPVEQMNAMAALRLGTNMMRQEFTHLDRKAATRDIDTAISADEDSIAMEVPPSGSAHAIYEFKKRGSARRAVRAEKALAEATGINSAYHLIAGMATVAAAVARIRENLMPLEPDPGLSHAANYLYMITGRRPTPAEEKIMDIALILHADHGMNASTFASLVVASTLSDIYLSISSGVAALTGPLHGGANEGVIRMLTEIGGPRNVKAWYKDARAQGRKVTGFGHRVYKQYDPRARILGPIAGHMTVGSGEDATLMKTALELEKVVIGELAEEKGIYPNVDFYSGLVYTSLGIPTYLFTPTFAVARVTGWTARVLEYLKNNRIFRPRAIYTGRTDSPYVPMEQRKG